VCSRFPAWFVRSVAASIVRRASESCLTSIRHVPFRCLKTILTSPLFSPASSHRRSRSHRCGGCSQRWLGLQARSEIVGCLHLSAGAKNGGSAMVVTSDICNAQDSCSALLDDAAIVWEKRLRARSRPSRRVPVWKVALLLVWVRSRLNCFN
jgi:hypothetical protein